MSLLIAYLGVSKVTLAYERYMSCRIEVGRALAIVREINQYCITLTESDYSREATEWRKETKTTLEQLIHGTVTMIKNSRHAQQLATNGYKDQKGDPFELIHYLRGHLYHGSKSLSKSNLELLERCKMMDLLHEFTNHYRELVRLASTPMPFALVQMGRTFMFIWVMSLPLVLSGKDFDDIVSVFSFIILLTYGFLGLEMVAMKMANPFGEEAKDDLNVKGMAKAAIWGMENDSSHSERAACQATDNSPRSYLFSQRILSAPSENLDDSKDELADDDTVASNTSLQGFGPKILGLPALPVPHFRLKPEWPIIHQSVLESPVTSYVAMTGKGNSQSEEYQQKTTRASTKGGHRRGKKSGDGVTAVESQLAEHGDGAGHDVC
jgi:predicted membrane chloride channel (bestrophin family)